MLKKLIDRLLGLIYKLRHTDYKKLAKFPRYFVFNVLLPFFRFNILLLLYIVNSFIILKLGRIKFIPPALVSKIQGAFVLIYVKGMKTFDKRPPGSISSLSIMDLAINNLKRKKSRTFITIGGVAIGIGAIVFLVSIGYGLQNLVISRVAKLHEVKQINVSPRQGSKEKLSDKLIANIKAFENIENILPLIAVVGRVNYNNSISSVAVYGVTSDYLTNSAIKTSFGRIFDSNELVAANFTNDVLGATTIDQSIYEEEKFYNFGQKLNPVRFQISPGTWVRVRGGPTTKSSVIGYSKYFESELDGIEYIGEYYVSDDSSHSVKDKEGEELGRWIKSKFNIWTEATCDKTKPECFDGKYLVKKDISDKQVQTEGYVSLININILKGEVLAESTTAEELALEAVVDGTEDTWIEIPEESGIQSETESQKVPFAASAKKEAVVNTAMLRIMGLEPQDAVGKKFTTAFIATGDVLPPETKKLESQDAEYEIVGVIDDDKSPIFYVAYADLRGLGIVNNSQLKVVVKDKDVLPKTRTQIESMGFGTTSVVDTITQINNLFSTIRGILAVMGMVALSVASLGMFNTFTISLLERTREIGLMKAMGMKSTEVQELFLTESMIMGFSGGVSGLLTGYLFGFVLNSLISTVAVARGVGIINVTYIPSSFVVLILILSMIVGIGTGIYPALRAKSISALNALRYE